MTRHSDTQTRYRDSMHTERGGNAGTVQMMTGGRVARRTSALLDRRQ